MGIFVARQPLFNKMEEVYGYELFCRNNQNDEFSDVNQDKATADVIINSFLNIGMEKMSAGKPCFINFTEKLLELGVPAYFEPRDIVIELLETIKSSKKIVHIM